MSVTAADYKTKIIADVGDTTGGPVQTTIDTIWNMFDKIGVTALHLQYLYAKKEAIETMMGYLREIVSFKTEQTEIQNIEQQQTLARLWHLVDGSIEKFEKGLRAGGAIGEISQKEPIDQNSDPTTTLMPNAADRRYRGDPYFPRLPNNSQR